MTLTERKLNLQYTLSVWFETLCGEGVNTGQIREFMITRGSSFTYRTLFMMFATIMSASFVNIIPAGDENPCEGGTVETVIGTV